MLGSADLVAFVPTLDLAKARAFYEGVLGLQVERDTPQAVVVRAGNGTMLRVTAVPALIPHPFTVLGWAVTDLDAIVAALTEHDVHTQHYDGLDQDERGVWTTPSGDRIVWFLDPDGNNLSLTEFAGTR
jgi:catechol 2,3-dioxygenase-like lactoylglutathione lyase family enzyme